MESRTFDRAVDFYDKTRGLPDDVMARVVDVLVAELQGRTCLDIGAGTGRFTIPLKRAGIDVAGMDLSEPMLRNLLSKPDGEQIPVCVADATRLPFGERVFDAGLVCHVLHLIPRWRDALGELFRVVGGGLVLHDYGDFGHYEWRELMERFLDEAGLPNRHPGANEAEEVDAAARDLGATVRLLDPIPGSRKTSLARSIAGLERGNFSITWGADDETRRAAAERIKPWAERRFGDLEVERELPFMVRCRVYEVPKGTRA